MSVDELESNFKGGQEVSLANSGWLVTLSSEESRVVLVGVLSLSDHDPFASDWSWLYPADLERRDGIRPLSIEVLADHPSVLVFLTWEHLIFEVTSCQSSIVKGMYPHANWSHE